MLVHMGAEIPLFLVVMVLSTLIRFGFTQKWQKNGYNRTLIHACNRLWILFNFYCIYLCKAHQ